MGFFSPSFFVAPCVCDFCFRLASRAIRFSPSVLATCFSCILVATGVWAGIRCVQ